MKEFVVYTLLRLGLLVGAFAATAGVWLALTGGVNIFWTLVIAFIVSGLGSFVLLDRQREAFARRVDERARRATARLREREDAQDAADAAAAERDERG